MKDYGDLTPEEINAIEESIAECLQNAPEIRMINILTDLGRYHHKSECRLNRGASPYTSELECSCGLSQKLKELKDIFELYL